MKQAGEELLTVAEIAEEMKSSRATVTSLIRKGDLIAMRWGRTWRVRRSDLNIYLQGNSNQQTAEVVVEAEVN